MAKHIDRCGNCAFARPTAIEEDKVECIYGGVVSLPMSKNNAPCICYRPSVKELRKRNPYVNPQPKKEEERKEHKRPTFLWNPDKDKQLRELCSNKLYTIKDIANVMGLTKKDIVNRMNTLGIVRETRSNTASKARTAFRDGNNLPLPQQKYPRIKCCKGQCCKYKEQCAHYAHWLEMGKPQFDTINSVGSCINAPYTSGVVRSETLHTFREFIGLDGENEPEPSTYTEIL